jgi:hypothetical protein
MHPELSKRLSNMQVREALGRENLFNERVKLEAWEYPNLHVRFRNANGLDRLLHFELSNYDFQPAAVEAVDPVSRGPLADSQRVMRDGGEFPDNPLLGGRRFLCIEGTRAYYMHPGHRPQVTGGRWESLRSGFRLAELIAYITSKFTSGSWR